MTINILYLGHPDDWDVYRSELPRALQREGVDGVVSDTLDPAHVDYIVYAPVQGREDDFSVYSRAKAVMSLWAGVERIVSNPTLTQHIARMADTGLREGMVEWVVGHTLRYHLGMDAHIAGQDGIWRAEPIAPLARNRKVGVLGLGELGAASATALAALNFETHGWSRSAKEIAGVTCHHGQQGLADILAVSEILILLLPNTPATQKTLNATTLAMLPRGAFVINPGRGPLIDHEALLAALDCGQVAHATLDVFNVEPLPVEHPYWAHRSVTVTPHIASATRTDTAAAFVAANIARCEAGEPMVAEVDRTLGY